MRGSLPCRYWRAGIFSRAAYQLKESEKSAAEGFTLSYPFIIVGWLGRGFMRCESVDTFWALMPILAQGPTFWFSAFVGPWHFGLLIGLPGRVRRSCGSPPIRGSIIGRSRASSGWRPSSCARPSRWRLRLPIARTEAWEPCLATGADALLVRSLPAACDGYLHCVRCRGGDLPRL